MNTERVIDITQAEHTKADLVRWLRDWFERNGQGCKAIVGISGGCDSTVVAALCCEAVGKENVVGILMPNVIQQDIEDSHRVVEALGIQSYTIPITIPVAGITKQLEHEGIGVSSQAATNLPARIRMATLYAVSQSLGGRVINTSNFSERSIGWGTRWGDTVGDVCPLAMLTKTEVREIGHTFDNIPADLIDKAPADGLTGKSDEDNFGFTYEELDNYLLHGFCRNENALQKILQLRSKSRFKLNMPDMYYPSDINT